MVEIEKNSSCDLTELNNTILNSTILNSTSYIYLDSASTGYVYPEAITIAQEDMGINWGNPSNTYRFGEKAKKIINESREEIAATIKADPSEIFFTSGASEGNAWALKQREICYCSPYEHHNYTDNSATLVLSNDDAILSFHRNDLASVKDVMKRERYAYAHMLCSNETGEVFDVNKYFEAVRKFDMFTICDMTQAFGNMEIDIHNYDCDFAVFSGHKFHAPKGCGFCYIPKHIQSSIVPLIYGTQQSSMRGGTENVPYIHAMAYAAKKTADNIAAKRYKSKLLQKVVLNLIPKDETYVINETNPIYAEQGRVFLPTTLNFFLKDVESEVIQSMLSDKHIYIGVGSGCSNGKFEPSATALQMKVPEEYITGPIRLSFSLKNDVEDVTIAVNELLKCYTELKM